MDEWQQDWMKALETISTGIEQFFDNVGKEMSEAVEAFVEFADELADGLEETIAPGLEQVDEHIAEWMEPILWMVGGLESTIDQAVEPVTHTVEPLLNQYPICMGCRHYHGHSYNGVMLVCAMHPYGIVDGSESCPDKEAVSWRFPTIGISEETDDRF